MKSKCLIVIPGIPYPPINGHKLKIFNLINILSKHYDLHLISISLESPSEEENMYLRDRSYKSSHFKISYPGALRRVLSALFTRQPLQVAYYTLPCVIEYIEKECHSDEFVFLNLIRSAGYIHLFNKKKVILDMVDLLSRSYTRSSFTTTSLLFKLIYKIEAKRLRLFEEKSVKGSSLSLFVNQDEATEMKDIGNVAWLPNGVNEKLFIYQNYSRDYSNCIAFFGAMFYQPNIDAVLWFDQNVLDHIDPKIVFYIIGPKPSKQVLKIVKRRGNVVVTGFLKDPYLILNSCLAVVAPMQNGGGIQNKILETMALGKVNVLSTHAARPIKGANNNEHFIVQDDPKKMADVINDIYIRPQMYTQIQENATIFIKENYTWNYYEQELLFLLKSL